MSRPELSRHMRVRSELQIFDLTDRIERRRKLVLAYILRMTTDTGNAVA
jgi:hypothetical protein